MKTIICNNTWPWFNPFFEFSVFEPIIKYDNPVTEEVSKTPFAYHLKYAVPGYKKRDININVQDNILSIEGTSKKRKSWWNIKGGSTNESRFVRSTQLSNDMDVDKIKAKMKDGILNIDIPKKEQFISYREIPVYGMAESLNAVDYKNDKPNNIIYDLKEKIGGLFKKSA